LHLFEADESKFEEYLQVTLMSGELQVIAFHSLGLHDKFMIKLITITTFSFFASAWSGAVDFIHSSNYD
jgi:hypothetical protein